jgi:hypothetical protein
MRLFWINRLRALLSIDITLNRPILAFEERLVLDGELPFRRDIWLFLGKCLRVGESIRMLIFTRPTSAKLVLFKVKHTHTQREREGENVNNDYFCCLGTEMKKNITSNNLRCRKDFFLRARLRAVGCGLSVKWPFESLLLSLLSSSTTSVMHWRVLSCDGLRKLRADSTPWTKAEAAMSWRERAWENFLSKNNWNF